MAARLIEALWVTGYGAAAASGTVQFFAPGTQTQVTVYSNDAATAAVTQPVALDANGRTSVPCYVTVPARAIIRDSGGALLEDIERIDGDRAELVALNNPHYPLSTTADAAFTNIAASLGGTDGGYLGIGTGTVSRTLQQKLTDQISVRDYGAKGDGVTDDTAAINSALATVAATGSPGCVYLPAGTYLTSAPVSITGAGTTLRGDGPAVSIIKNTNSSLGGITIGAVSDISICELGVTNSGTSTAAAIAAAGGARHTYYRLKLSLHRSGITGVSGRCLFVDVDTDDNTAGFAYSVGNSSDFLFCTCGSGSDQSTGINVGTTATKLSVIGCVLPNMVAAGSRAGVFFPAGHQVAYGRIIGNDFNNGAVGGIDKGAAAGNIFGVQIYGNTGILAENPTGGGTLATGGYIAPIATVATLDFRYGRHFKIVGSANYSLTYNTNLGPVYGDTIHVIAQNTSGGGITLTQGTNTILATGGIAIAATSQASFTMTFDRVNTAKLVQSSAAVISGLS